MTETQSNSAVAAPAADADNKAFLQELKELLAACEGANKHDLAITAISACIIAEGDNGKQIVGILKHLGFHPGHAGAVLGHGTGNNPNVHRWQCYKNGRYSLHDEDTRG